MAFQEECFHIRDCGLVLYRVLIFLHPAGRKDLPGWKIGEGNQSEEVKITIRYKLSL
jgi:hypothetical protein